MEKKRGRNKEDVSKLILSAAMTLFVDKGIENTSMRNIADKIGYSPGNVYLYFKNKAEILFTLHSMGFKKLRGQFQVLNVIENPTERLKIAGKVYLKFAAENPELYNLMFSSAEPMNHLDEDNTEVWKEGNNTFLFLHNTVVECIEAGKFSGHDPEVFSFLVWSTVHGMANLSNAGRITRVKFSRPEEVLEEAYAAFERIIDLM